MIHLHITAWVLALILFAVTFSFYKNKKQKTKTSENNAYDYKTYLSINLIFWRRLIL